MIGRLTLVLETKKPSGIRNDALSCPLSDTNSRPRNSGIRDLSWHLTKVYRHPQLLTGTPGAAVTL